MILRTNDFNNGEKPHVKDSSAPFLTEIGIDSPARVFAADTDLFLSAGADVNAQRKSNRAAVFSAIALKLCEFGQKTLIVSKTDDELTGDARSAFRKKLAVSDFRFEEKDSDTASEESSADKIFSRKNEKPSFNPYTEEDYLRLRAVAEENDDIRSVFVIGSSEEISLGKRLATEFGIPLAVFITRPDGDSFLSPYFTVRREGRVDYIPSAAPSLAFFDAAQTLSERDMRRGAGFIAKALMTLPETDYLGGDYSEELLGVIKDCLFTDFTKITVQNKTLLFTSLLRLSALRSKGEYPLITPADGLMETLGLFGVDGKDYAYTCSRLIAEIYSDVLSEPELVLTPPPDTLGRFRRLSSLGANTRGNLGNDRFLNFVFPVFAAKIERLVKSLSLFENCCLTDPIPLSSRELRDAICASAEIFGQHGLLRDLFLAGYLPANP